MNSSGTCTCLDDCLQFCCLDNRTPSGKSSADGHAELQGSTVDLDLLLETILLCLLAPTGALQLRQLLLGLQLLSSQVVRALAQALQQQATPCHAARCPMDTNWGHGEHRVAEGTPGGSQQAILCA